jgi:protein-S-isoprenylcysteine O-methyltransferase Ste14
MITTQSIDTISRAVQELKSFEGCARLIVTLCTISVLTAVFTNFQLARGSRAIRAKRKSVVETGSMLAFFFGFYALIRLRIGVHEIPGSYYPMAIVGLLLLVLGAAVNIKGRFALGRNWGNQVIIYEDHSLVTGGIYRIVRHPLYASLIWMFLGASLVFQNWAALLATVLIFLPGMYYRAQQEEKALAAQFPGFKEYRNQTGMFFPMAMGPETVRVPAQAFAFCRISLTALVWIAFFLHSIWLVVAVFLILVLSVIVKVQRSPMIQLYQQTVLRFFPAQSYAWLDVPAMRFAHGFGALMSLAIILTILIAPGAGWDALAGFGMIKTISAFGFCPASKLFVCMRNGGCCALSKGDPLAH